MLVGAAASVLQLVGVSATGVVAQGARIISHYWVNYSLPVKWVNPSQASTCLLRLMSLGGQIGHLYWLHQKANEAIE